MPDAFELDSYVVDTLMRDLIGHDRSPAAYAVYLWLWRQTHGRRRPRVAISLQALATATGLSKSAVQRCVRHLVRRQLIGVEHAGATAAPSYRTFQPWTAQRGQDPAEISLSPPAGAGEGTA